MCVKIKKKNQTVNYDIDQPLERQLEGSEEIVVNYRSQKDPEVDRFLDEIEKSAKSGHLEHAGIKVVNNDNLPTVKAKKRVKKIQRHFQANELVQTLALSAFESDRKLDEISSLIKDRKHSVKKTG